MNRPLSLKTIVTSVRSLFLLAALSVTGSACLKVEVSALQEVGSLLPLVAVDTTPKYRYSNVGSGSGLNMSLYTVAGCGSGLISGSTQSVNAGQVTAYTLIQPGAYFFGVPAYGQCISFVPVTGGSYTLTDTTYYTLSITSP